MLGPVDYLSIGPYQQFTAEFRPFASGGGVSNVWPAANLAIYVPIYVRKPITVTTLWWNNGTNVGGPTIDMAIYNSTGGTRLATVGGATQGATGTCQATVLANALVLVPSQYWLGLVCGNNTTGIISSVATVPANFPVQKYIGCQQQQLASTIMPASTTFAAATNNYVPNLGVYRSTLTM